MKKFILSSAAVAMAMTMSATAMAGEGDSKYFKDVTANNYGWAVEYIDYIASNGIASGVGSDMYAPGSNIERGDFAILVDKTFNFKSGKLETYALRDVSEDSYYAQAIANCSAAGVITERGAYYPEDNIKRIDAVKMIYRALNSSSLLSAPSTDVSMFNDKADISGIEAQAAAASLNKIGIISGDDKGNLNPSATMTRAEMAVVFAKLDKYIDEYNTEASKKAEEKAKEEKDKEAEKEAADKESAKADESKNYSDEEITESINIAKGGEVTVENCKVVVTGDNAVTVSNDSKADIKNSSISSVGGSGVSAGNKAVVTIKDGSVRGTNGDAIKATEEAVVTVDGTTLKADGTNSQYAVNVSDEAKVTVNNTNIEAEDNFGGVKVYNGGKLELNDMSITASTGSGKGSYTGAIDVVSTNDSESVIDLKNVEINNSKGAAFYVRESDVTINIDESCKFNTSMLINSPNIYNNKQERGNNITLNMTGDVNIENTRIILDNMTVLDINIQDGATLGGQIDPDGSGYINLNMDQESTLVLDSDLYIDSFKNGESFDFNNIVDNGFDIYYNDNNSDNDWLEARTYDLLFGGRLMPYNKEPIVR